MKAYGVRTGVAVPTIGGWVAAAQYEQVLAGAWLGWDLDGADLPGAVAIPANAESPPHIGVADTDAMATCITVDWIEA